MDLSSLQAKYGPLVTPRQKAQPVTPKGRSGLSRWLPTALAVGGTLAAAPFTGGASLLGTAALLGGGAALGGAAGEFGAQKLNKEKANAGKVVKEAAISGVTGAIPFGGAAKAARVARVAEEGAPEATGLVARARSNMSLHGQQMDARSGGYSVNAKQPGTKELDISGSKKVANVLKNEGVKPGSPLSKLDTVETKLKDYGGQIDKTLSANNVTVSRGQRQAIADKFVSSMAKKLGSNKNVMEHAQSLASNFVKNGGNNAKDLVANKRQLDEDLISYIRNPDAALAHEQRAVVPFRQTLRDEINNLVPGLKEANNKYHDLSTAKGYLVKGTGEMNTKGGIIGRIAESGPIKTAESKVGNLMTKAEPGVTTTSRGMTSRVVREGVKQTVGQTAGNALLDNGQPPTETGSVADTVLPDTPEATDNTQNDTIKQALKVAMVQDLSSGGKNIGALSTIYKILQSEDKPTKLTSTQLQQKANAQSGLDALDTLKNEISNDPNALAKANTPGQSLPLVGGYVTRATGEGVLRTARKEASDVISRLRTGAAINQEEEKFYLSQLPQAGDSPDTINYKLGLLSSLFSQFVPPDTSSNTGGLTLDDLAGAFGGAQ